MKSKKAQTAGFDRKKLKHFQAQLERKRQELGLSVHRSESYGRELTVGETQDLADQANSSYQKEFLFSRSNGDRNILALVIQAIDRIDNSSFGICTYCGEEVESRRLEAVPWAPYCLRCQELAEQGMLD